MKKNFSWIHLTDFHCGIKQEWLWDKFKKDFLKDIEKQYDKSGGYDTIFFTGDLTNTGKKEEFNKLNKELDDIWEHLDKLGCKPSLLAVPGNHDLIRPNQYDSCVKVFSKWHDNDKEFREDFWESRTLDNNHFKQYIDKLRDVFSEYINWFNDAHTQKYCGLLKPEIKTGFIPGDFSATIEKDDIKVGILGLNTAFLQLTDGNYKGKLSLHPMQCNAACGDSFSNWIDKHNFCFLLTHHPSNWLHTQSLESFNNIIFTHNNFALHLCGHLHESQSTIEQRSNADPKRTWQGCSLFGLPHDSNKIEHSYGYAIGKVQFDQDQDAKIAFLPRKAQKRADGTIELDRDLSIRLSDDGWTDAQSIKLNITEKKQASSLKTEINSNLEPAISTKKTLNEPVHKLNLTNNQNFKFKNRIAELKQICGAEGEDLNKLPALIVIDSPAGMGKTVLLEEIQRYYQKNQHEGWKCLLINNWPSTKKDVRSHLLKHLQGKVSDIQNKTDIAADELICRKIAQDKYFLLFDDVEKLAENIIRWLMNLTYQHHKKTLNNYKLSPMRVIYCGRYIASGGQEYGWEARKYCKINLSGFDCTIIQEQLQEREVSVTQKESLPEIYKTWSKEILELSCGHPKIIQKLVDFLEENHWYVNFDSLERKKELFKQLILPEISNMLDKVEKEARESLEILSIFRHFNLGTAQRLKEQKKLSSNPIELLVKIGLVCQKSEHGYYSDSLLRDLILTKLKLINSHNFIELNDIAKKIFMDAAQDLVNTKNRQSLQDNSRKVEFYCKEILYHSAENSSLPEYNKNFNFNDDKEKVISILEKAYYGDHEKARYTVDDLILIDEKITELIDKN